MKACAPLRAIAPLSPVIGQRDRACLHIRRWTLPHLLWRRLTRVRPAAPSQFSYHASCSLSFVLHQKIVLGQKRRAKRDVGRTEPAARNVSIVLAWPSGPVQALDRHRTVYSYVVPPGGAAPMRPRAANRLPRSSKLDASPFAVTRLAVSSKVVRSTAFPIRCATSRSDALGAVSAALRSNTQQSADHFHPKRRTEGALAAASRRKTEGLLVRPATRWTRFGAHAGPSSRRDQRAPSTLSRTSPERRPADRAIVTFVYRSRATVVRDMPAQVRQRHAPELVWPSPTRSGVQTGLQRIASRASAPVLQEAPAGIAGRAMVPAPAAAPRLPDLNRVVDEVMRRIDRQVRNERLRRGM